MMIVQMDKMSAPPSRELAQQLYNKNIELENRRHRSAQARVPLDPNTWQQIRENYEAIILEDHAFSEQHNIEYALWQLHYRRIEEFRAQFSAAIASNGSSTSQGIKVPPRPDRINKIRFQFKNFLSEATGFYHDLILKIRAKHGLPLGSFSEESETRTVMEKDGKRSMEMTKGLISCHRCLIYLGDLARYKGLYGEGDSKSRDYAAASSYYLQAASLWPSSGNPHHQLAILATYSGDELVAVYRYFRSLAVDSPFSTARDNLIVAFEKNRQSFSQLHRDIKASAITESSMQITAKGRGKSEEKLQPVDANVGASLFEGRASSIQELYKAFCIRFVRLNGILFTRTSLETFAEVLSLVSCTLNELLSPGPEEELNFGTDAVENGLVIVRLISILIFTVHYVNREGESQSYADIVQRTVLLHNALAAVYELVGALLKKCIQLHDPCSSYLLPGILVFVEWLACSPDGATCNDKDGKQAAVRSVFWNHFIAFLNKLLSSEMVVMDDDDETCFFNISRYEEGETENRLALWEDFELRGFLPLQPAQTILEFSRKHFVRGDGNNEKIVRVKRILAAARALANVVTIDQKNMIFDLKEKKFVIGVNSQTSEDFMLTPYLGSPKLNDMGPQLPTETTKSSVIEQPKAFVEGEEEDEVIVFKPTVTEKRSDLTVSKWVPPEALEPGKNAIAGNSHFPGGSASGRHRDLHQQMVFDATSQSPVSVASHVLPHLQSVYSHSSMWLDQQCSLANGLSGLCIMENGHVVKPGMQEDLPISHNVSFSLPTQQSASVNASGTSYSQEKASEMMMQSKINPIASSGVTSGSLAVNMSSALPASSKKGPVNRPLRHLGPPPGFSSVPPRQANGPISGSDLVADNLLPDDYSWLDGYALPLTTKGSRPNQSTNHPFHSNSNRISKNDGFVGTTSFPFPGKQVLPKQFPLEKQNGWEDNHTLEHLNLQQQQLHLQQPMKGDQEFIPQGKSLWSGLYPV